MGKVFASPPRRRSLAYVALGLGLLAVRLPLGHITRDGNAEIHTLLETIATLLAFVIGAMALVRYYSQKNAAYLILGSGFLSAGLLDAYHTIVTSSFCIGCTPSSLSALTAWTGVISRLFLPLLMCASLFIWRGETKRPSEDRIRERTVYLLVGGWTLASFVFLLWVPLLPAYQPQWPIHRPGELFVGLFFAIAAACYLRKTDWRADGFTHSLVLFLIITTLSQIVYMPFSARLFDTLHLATHVLKILAYAAVLSGLFRSMYSVFRHESEARAALTRANESLALEVGERQRAEAALQQSRDELEARVEARTADLAEQGELAALVSEIAILLTQGDSVQKTLQRSAELTNHFLDAAFVRIWILNKDQNVLELQASAGICTHLKGGHARVSMGQFKIGCIAQQGQPYLTNDVMQEPWVGDPDWARRQGVVAFAGYPLIVGEEVVGVVAAFARQPLSKAVYQTFGSLAGSISQFIGRKRMEAALQDSEERVRLLLDSTAEAIYGINLKGKCTFANRACWQMLGYENAESLLGRNMHDVLHHTRANGSPYPAAECHIFRAFRKGEGTHVDDEVLWRADGTSFPAEYWSYPVRKEGEVVAAVVTFFDITERKRAEEEQRKLALLVETSDDFIVIASPEQKVLYLNQGGAKMIGLDSPGQALGMDISALHPESAWARIERQLPAVMKTGHGLEESQLLHTKTGDRIDVLLNTFVLRRPETGEVLCLAAVMRDITERKRAEDKLRTSEERFRIATENASDMTFELDLRTGELDYYGLFADRLGDRPAPRDFDTWKSMVHPDDLGPILAALPRHIETGERYIGEYRVPGENGRTYFYSLRGQAIRERAGQSHKIIGLLSDITERKQAEEAISQLAAIVQGSEDAIIGTTLSGTITTWNGGAERLLGYTTSEALGASLAILFRRVEQAWDILDPSSRGAVNRLDEAVFVCKEGLEVHVSLTVSPIRKASGEITGVATIARDISARKKAEIALAHQAQHDHLTGLPNPLLLADRLASSIQRASRSGLMTAVIYVDLDGFKFVNDTLGHEAGDSLLKLVTGRLQACLREPDTLARMGGDEFMVVVSEVRDEGIASSIAERLRTALHRPFQVADHELYVTASIGIAMCPRDGTDVGTLRRDADAAMYAAKRSGKDRIIFFTPAMRDTFLEHLELETELRHALDRGNELSLVYQPIFDAQSGRQTALEALLRWAHPTLGNISPAKFVPVAEESGLIFRLGEWVLKQACRQCRLWQEHGLGGVRVAANVSALEFARSEFSGNVLRVLAESGLPGNLLDLEVTETTLMRDMDESIRKMSLLRARGIRISIDDFGTGYSSLGYLPRLPVDTLKIDRSFVADLGANSTAQSLIEGMISLAHSIGKQVVVEGVETNEQLELLKSMGCDEIQGFLLGRPAELPAWDEPAVQTTKGTVVGPPLLV